MATFFPRSGVVRRRVLRAVLALGLLSLTYTLSLAATKITKNARPKPPVLVNAAVAPEPATTNASRSCTKVRIMPLGDSLTAFPDSYRGPLFRNLVERKVDVDFVGSVSWGPAIGGDVDGEGHGGFTIGPDDRVDDQGGKSNLFDNVDRWIPAAKPEIILLTIGTNDMAGGGTWVSQAPGKLTALVKKIQGLAPDAVIVVGDIPPSTYDPTSTNVNNDVNAAARALGSASPNDTVIYGDTAKRLLKTGFQASKDTVDGIHFSPSGGEMFATAWQPAVDEALRLTGRNC